MCNFAVCGQRCMCICFIVNDIDVGCLFLPNLIFCLMECAQFYFVLWMLMPFQQSCVCKFNFQQSWVSTLRAQILFSMICFYDCCFFKFWIQLMWLCFSMICCWHPNFFACLFSLYNGSQSIPCSPLFSDAGRWLWVWRNSWWARLTWFWRWWLLPVVRKAPSLQMAVAGSEDDYSCWRSVWR